MEAFFLVVLAAWAASASQLASEIIITTRIKAPESSPLFRRAEALAAENHHVDYDGSFIIVRANAHSLDPIKHLVSKYQACAASRSTGRLWSPISLHEVSLVVAFEHLAGPIRIWSQHEDMKTNKRLIMIIVIMHSLLLTN